MYIYIYIHCYIYKYIYWYIIYLIGGTLGETVIDVESSSPKKGEQDLEKFQYGWGWYADAKAEVAWVSLNASENHQRIYPHNPPQNKIQSSLPKHRETKPRKMVKSYKKTLLHHHHKKKFNIFSLLLPQWFGASSFNHQQKSFSLPSKSHDQKIPLLWLHKSPA